jgi:hypothetical protein
MIYTSREKELILIFSTITILCYFLYTLLDILELFGILKTYTSANYNQLITDPIYVVSWIIFVALLLLLFFTIKGASRAAKFEKNNKPYVVLSIIYIAYLVLYFPTYEPNLPTFLWIIVDFLGIIITVPFLVSVFKKH